MNRSSSTPAPARQAAQELLQVRKRRERRSRLLLRWGIVGGVAAVLAIIAVVIVSTTRAGLPATGSAPAHGNGFGGITLTSPAQLAPTEPHTVDASAVAGPEEGGDAPATPGGVQDPGGTGPVPVIAWVDVNCVHCADLENTYSDRIRAWLEEGAITMEYRTVAFLDRNSPSAYSTRAANALACVADTSPQAYLPFLGALFANFPQGELGDDALAARAQDAGAEDISSCLENGTFRPWVSFASSTAAADGITGTPTVYVDGRQLESPADFEAAITSAIDSRHD